MAQPLLADAEKRFYSIIAKKCKSLRVYGFQRQITTWVKSANRLGLLGNITYI